jgi:SAM-dependent methyltransferase
MRDMRYIPVPSEGYDGFIAVASYHHLESDADRKKALEEMYRILKKGGRGLIVVWAREQEPDSRFVFNSTMKTSQFGWDEFVDWKGPYYKKDEKKRYYHIYEKGDLVSEVSTLCPSFCIESIEWEKGNWIVSMKK